MMLLQKIWERYFFKETLKTALLFLGCFYGLYILIDYAHHSSLFRAAGNPTLYWRLVATYYASEFIEKSELLLPIAILLGTVRVLCKLNEQNELVALMAGGVSARNLMKPFLLLGILGTLALYVNNQMLLPMAAKQLSHITERQSSKERKSDAIEAQILMFEDQSMLIYQKYDRNRDLFIDTFWIRPTGEIHRIKELSLSSKPPTAYFVDTLQRENGAYKPVGYSPKIAFPEMFVSSHALADTVTPPEALSLTMLWEKIPPGHQATSEKQARILATFHRKLLFPWLCILAVLAPAPFCMRFSRRFPVFLIYACSLFGFMAIYIAMNAAHVLGRRQLVDPVLAIWLPFLGFSLIAFLLQFNLRSRVKFTRECTDSTLA